MKNPFDELNSVIKSKSTILLTINISYHKVLENIKTKIALTCNYTFFIIKNMSNLASFVFNL